MENLKWISAMSERLRDELSKEYDDETKDLIIRAFRNGLFPKSRYCGRIKIFFSN